MLDLSNDLQLSFAKTSNNLNFVENFVPEFTKAIARGLKD
jgi:hypothetical protein